MPSLILTETVASITELKKNPMGTFHAGAGRAVAILNRNQPAFYCVPPHIYEYLLDLAEDAELAKLVEERQDDETIAVDLQSLRR